MSDLCWLYVHGVLAGRAFVALAAGAGALASWAAFARKVRARAKGERALLGPAITSAEGLPARGDATVEGALVDPSAPERRGDALVRDAMTVPAQGQLAIALDDGTKVALSGAPRLAAGTREGRTRARAEARTIARVRFGDRVVARGELAREPSAEGHGYRTQAADARLELPVVVGARPPIVTSAPLGGLARGALVGLAAGIVAAWIGGGAALQARSQDLGDRASLRAVAAASPFHREAALRALLGRLEEPNGNTARAVEVALLLGDCPHAAGIWLDAGDGPRADAVARACGAGVPGDAFLKLGEVRLASEAFACDRSAPTIDVCTTHVAAGAWTNGSACVRAYAKGREDEADRPSRERAQALGCIADALDARAGDAAALGRLGKAASVRAMCRVLYADLLHGSERLALFSDRSAMWAWQDSQGMDFAKGRVVSTAARLTEEEEGPGPPERYAYSVFKDAPIASPTWESEHRSDTPICLMRHLLQSDAIPPEAFGYRVMLVGNVAQLLATLGEYDAAKDVLERVRDVPEPPDAYDTIWHRPTYAELWGGIRSLRSAPESGSRWTGSVRGHAVFAIMDDAASARREAQARGDAVDDARRGKVVRRFRDVVFDRATCVPLHMLEAFDRH